MSEKRRAHGPTVKAVREALGMRSDQLAERAGISPGYLSNIEAGRRRPEPDKTAAIAAALRRDDLDVTIDVTALTGQEPVIGSLRRVLGITLPDLAGAAGITPEQLERVERGLDIPEQIVLERISRRLGIDLAALVYPLDVAS